ncbi:hypothetical protein [Flavobacterium sp.]|uniref:hypothetical protein n=1 Tax=Flavobacterium sp. TaxID=239 RepID=UPI0037538C50
MKKYFILLVGLLAYNSFASDLIFKKEIILNQNINLQTYSVKKIHCDEAFAFQVEIATDILMYNLDNPPSSANSWYYNTVWANYNTLISNASATKKICNGL